MSSDGTLPEAWWLNRNGVRQIRLGSILLAVGMVLSAWLARAAIYQVMILSAGLGVVGLLLILSGLLQRSGRYDNGFVTILNDFQEPGPASSSRRAAPRSITETSWPGRSGSRAPRGTPISARS